MEYYRRRAPEYDRLYDKPERQGDLQRMAECLRTALAGRRVLELACGTGYWTAVAADVVESILATDANEAVLEIARDKHLDPARVRYAIADAYDPRLPSREFDAGLAMFWWSHIPRAWLGPFLESFHAALAPGACVVLGDNRFVSDSNSPVSRIDDAGNAYQLRYLDDGSEHEVLKNFPSTAELRETLEPFAEAIEITNFDYYWCVTYRTRGR